jgi:hypothetical protein
MRRRQKRELLLFQAEDLAASPFPNEEELLDALRKRHVRLRDRPFAGGERRIRSRHTRAIDCRH